MNKSMKFVKQLQQRFRLRQPILPGKLPSRLVSVLAAITIIFAAGSLLAVRTVTAHNHAAEQAKQARIVEARKLEDRLLTAKKQSEQEQASAKAAASTPTGQKGATGASPKATPEAVKKYATSSDPRSTAYSTVPPAPNPASFTTKITHNGQLAAGSVVYYNATKGEKVFYGGDLLLGTPSVTISKSNGALSSKNITVTVPDGATIGIPSTPWDDHSPYFFIAMSTSQVSGTTFDMFVESYGGPPVGTYQLHISTGRVAQTADGWQYDAFIVVNIVE